MDHQGAAVIEVARENANYDILVATAAGWSVNRWSYLNEGLLSTAGVFSY